MFQSEFDRCWINWDSLKCCAVESEEKYFGENFIWHQDLNPQWFSNFVFWFKLYCLV